MQLFFHDTFVFGVVVFVVVLVVLFLVRSVACVWVVRSRLSLRVSRTFITILNTINDIVVLSSGQP